MNKKIKSMLEAAGFMMWEDEAWAPPDGGVDWNGDYSVELTTFIHDLVCQAARVAATAEGEFNDRVYYAVFDHFITNTNNHEPSEPSEMDEWLDYDKDC